MQVPQLSVVILGLAQEQQQLEANANQAFNYHFTRHVTRRS